MTTPNNPRDELRIEIIDWIDSVTCDVHQTKSDYEYCADQILFQVDTYVKGIIGEDFDVANYPFGNAQIEAVVANKLKAEQRQKAGLENE